VIQAHEQGPQAAVEVFLDRRDFFGPAMLHHPLFTAAFGAALGLATWSGTRSARIALPLLGLGIAILMHAINNGLMEFVLVLRYGLTATAEWVRGTPTDETASLDATADGVVVALRLVDYVYITVFLVLILLWLRYQRRVIERELAEETWLSGRPEAAVVTHYWRRTVGYWRLLLSGDLDQWQRLRRAHAELTDLALLKWRVRKFGGDDARVRRRRRRLRNLLAPETTQELEAVGIYQAVRPEK
jgi:hypothetical protein